MFKLELLREFKLGLLPQQFEGSGILMGGVALLHALSVLMTGDDDDLSDNEFDDCVTIAIPITKNSTIYRVFKKS